MNEYETKVSKLESDKCDQCSGSGKCDDSAPGDISYREWVCPIVKGQD